MDEYIPYNADTILALCKLMPRFDGIRARGMLILTPPVEYSSKKQDRNDWYNITSVEMWHRPYRKGNSVYRIDDVGPILIDFERALERAISDKARARIELHFKHGYSRSELALMEGVSESAIKNSLTRAIETMAEWLETPRASVQIGRNVNEREESYRRTYSTHPR